MRLGALRGLNALTPARIRRRSSTRGVSQVLFDRRRVYILPTGHGLGFALVLSVMLLGAVNYDNALAYMLCFLLGSIALVSILHTYRNLAGLRVSAKPGQPVFAGAAAHFELHIENSTRAARPALRVQGPQGSKPAARVSSACVPANDSVTLDLVSASRVRGWHPLGRLRVATTHPIGLFRAWGVPNLDARVLVYPAPAGTQPFPQSATQSAQDGVAKGMGEEDFFGLRDYAPGDSPRRIHWKAAARADALAVKQFAGTSPKHIALRWQDVAAPAPEAKLSQLCRWVIEAERARLCFSLSIPGETVPPDTGPEHLERCLAALALWEPPRTGHA